MFTSERLHGPLFAQYELRIEAIIADDADIERIANKLEELEVEESLAAVARRIEKSIPDVRVEVVW